MKTRRKPEKTPAGLSSFEFRHQAPENLLRVERDGAGVTIRAARDNFSLRDKTFFVRYLANEGFISQRHRRFAAEQRGGRGGLEWLVEEGHPRTGWTSAGATPRATAFMIRLFVYGFLVWVLQITMLFVTAQ
jgi:hypothetical protein